MVYFPETGTPATADTMTVFSVWTERIDSACRKMPGLRLTLSLAARLWGLQAPQCLAPLGALVERGRLVETPEGPYGVRGDLRRARPRRVGRPCAS